MLPFTNRQMLIMYELLHEEYKTAADLALNLGVSVRTIKSEIQKLKELLVDYDIHIESISGIGYYIQASNDNGVITLKSFHESNIMKKVYKFNKSNSDRIAYILDSLLSNDSYIKIDELVDELFISRGSVVRDLKEVRNQLARFNLSIYSKPSFGIKVVGLEKDIRNAIVELKYNNDLSLEIINEFEYQSVIKEVGFVEDQLRLFYSEYRLSDFSFANVAFHFYIMSKRHQLGYQLDNSNYKANERLYTTTQYALKKIFKIDFPVDEINYAAQQIDYKKIIDTLDDTEDYEKVMNTIFDEIKNNFGLNFSHLELLKQQIYSHITQMVLRIRSGMVIKNPIAYNNLRDYTFASKLTVSVVSIIDSIYQIQVGVDEFAYLVLYLESALQLIDSKQQIRIGFNSGQSRVEDIVFYKEVKDKFEDQYTHIVKTNYDDETADILVTTRKSDKAHVFSIQDSNYLDQIERYIHRIRSEAIDMGRYFNEKSIISNLQGSNSVEVMANLWNEMDNRDLLKVMSYSKDYFIGLEVGNQVVHLQDFGKSLKNPIFMIAILDKPIIWDKTVVRVLVLIKTKKDGDQDLHTLCSILAKWLNNSNAIVKLIDDPSLNSLVSNTL